LRILAAHQPNYHPWLGLFHKVARADVWVLADDVQYSHPGFTNRNRIRTADGWSWLTIPVRTRGQAQQRIGQVEVVDHAWQRKHWTAIRHAYHQASHFETGSDFLESFYADVSRERLLDVNVDLIGWMLEQFGIDVEIRFSSQLELRPERTERLVDMVRACDCDAYLAGDGGSRDYLRPECFEDAGVQLLFGEFEHPVYAQCHDGFEAKMSAVDLLLNHGPAEARRMMGLDQA
jgi:hypothetical protein